MKTLLLLRHAKSSWKQPSAGDHERKLKKRGRKDAGKAGQLLTAEGLLPDLILSSTAPLPADGRTGYSSQRLSRRGANDRRAV